MLDSELALHVFEEKGALLSLLKRIFSINEGLCKTSWFPLVPSYQIQVWQISALAKSWYPGVPLGPWVLPNPPWLSWVFLAFAIPRWLRIGPLGSFWVTLVLRLLWVLSIIVFYSA